MVSVCNSSQVRKRDRGGRYATTKSDHCFHGLGLYSVEQAVEPYCGQLEVEYRDGVFRAAVVMYGCYGEK